MIGDGPLKKEVQKKIQEKGLDNDIYLLGIRNDIPQIMGALDIFLLPSLYEGLGIVLVEAQAAGVPCVVSDKIPDEADMGMGLIKKVDLKEEINVWVDNILASFLVERNSWEEIYKAISHKKYDINIVSKYLEQIYYNSY